MAAADFPNSPSIGQSFTVDNKTYEWNGTFWEMAISTATIADGSIEGVKLASMSASVGDFLGWDGTEWGPESIPTINTLDDIGDVSASAAASGDFLKWNGSSWVNGPINLGADTTGNYMSDITAGTGVTVTHTPGEGSTASVSLDANLDDLSDVAYSSASAGHVLKWNGSFWVNDYPSVRVSDSAPSDPEPGEIWYESDTGKTFVYYDSAWVEMVGSTGAAGADGIVQDVGYESGQYYGPPGTTGTTGSLTTSRTYYASFYIGKTVTFDRIGCSTGAGFSGTAVVRLGVYNNDNATGKPSTVNFDAGTFSVTAVNTTSAITISKTLTKGWYWTAVNMQTAATTPTFRVSGPFHQSPFMVSTSDNMNSRPSYYEDGITGAFATAGTLVRQGNTIPIAMLRVA